MNKFIMRDHNLLSSISKPCVRIIKSSDREIITVFQAYVDNLYSSKVIISQPSFKNDKNETLIDMYYFEVIGDSFPKNLAGAKLGELASRYYNTNITVNLTRIHYPYMNASVFSRYLFYNSSANTFIHFQNAVQKYFSWHGKDLIAHVKGIKIEISGRIITEKVIPRVTKKSIVLGSLSKSDFIDYSKYTDKNYMGSITIKV